MEKDTLQAIHDDDLVAFLSRIGVADQIESGKALCKFCRRSVSLNDLAALFPESGDVKFICNKADCIQALLETREIARSAS